MEVGTLKLTLKIKKFSELHNRVYSNISSLGPYKWRMFVSPTKGYRADICWSIYLGVVNFETLPSGWRLNAKYSFTFINQIDNKSSFTIGDDAQHEFNGSINSWGADSLMSEKKLRQIGEGFLVENMYLIEADVTVYECGKDEPTKEDMEAAIADLNSVIFPKKVVSSEEEAKQALAMIEEAFNMTPLEINNPSRVSQLAYAFDVLDSLDDCSMVASKRKEKLFIIQEDLNALLDRAAKAAENIKLFTDKELDKKTLDHKCVRCLMEFEKAKAEIVQNEQDIVSLEEQIGDKKRNKERASLKQKEMFKLCKELKVELDELLRNWPEYEAKMKAAKEEQKVIGMEWSKRKQLVSSLEKPFYSSLKPGYVPAKKSVKKKKLPKKILTRSSYTRTGFYNNGFSVGKSKRSS